MLFLVLRVHPALILLALSNPVPLHLPDLFDLSDLSDLSDYSIF